MYSSMYGTDYYDAAESLAAVSAIMGPVMFISFAVMIIMLVSQWKLFTKAGRPGWACLIPIYNLVVMLQIVGKSPWLILLMLIPIANFVFAIMLQIWVAQAYGKSTAYGIGLLFLPVIFYPMLAFGSSEYQGA